MPVSLRVKRSAASRLLPLTRPGAGDLAEECALLGISRPGPAWEAKGSDCQWEPGTGQGGGTGWAGLPHSLLGTQPMPCPALSSLAAVEAEPGGRRHSAPSREYGVLSPEPSTHHHNPRAAGREPLTVYREAPRAGSPLITEDLRTRETETSAPIMWPARGRLDVEPRPLTSTLRLMYPLPHPYQQILYRRI